MSHPYISTLRSGTIPVTSAKIRSLQSQTQEGDFVALTIGRVYDRWRAAGASCCVFQRETITPPAIRPYVATRRKVAETQADVGIALVDVLKAINAW